MKITAQMPKLLKKLQMESIIHYYLAHLRKILHTCLISPTEVVTE